MSLISKLARVLANHRPNLLSPYPALTVLPAFVLSSLHLWAAAVIVPTLFFLLWNPGLFRGEGKIPRRSLGLLIVAVALTVIWFVAGWKDGLHYQGAKYIYAVCIVNIAWVILLGAMFARYWKSESSFRVSLVLQWLVFVWLAWYAFPYLGELP
jgi:hypothetical protein